MALHPRQAPRTITASRKEACQGNRRPTGDNAHRHPTFPCHQADDSISSPRRRAAPRQRTCPSSPWYAAHQADLRNALQLQQLPFTSAELPGREPLTFAFHEAERFVERPAITTFPILMLFAFTTTSLIYPSPVRLQWNVMPRTGFNQTHQAARQSLRTPHCFWPRRLATRFQD